MITRRSLLTKLASAVSILYLPISKISFASTSRLEKSLVEPDFYKLSYIIHEKLQKYEYVTRIETYCDRNENDPNVNMYCEITMENNHIHPDFPISELNHFHVSVHRLPDVPPAGV